MYVCSFPAYMQTLMTFFMTHFGLCYFSKYVNITSLSQGSRQYCHSKYEDRCTPHTLLQVNHFIQGFRKRCRLSLLTNSALVYKPKCGGKGGVAGSRPMSTAVHRTPIKLWRSNSIYLTYDFNPYSFLHEANIRDGGKTVHVCPT
jgi:hypothetical protein